MASIFDSLCYQYEPLPTSTSIRLLRIHRTRGGILPSLCGYPLIQCSLQTIDLEASDIPVYAALSYTWDSPAAEKHKRGTDNYTDEYGPLCKWPILVRDERAGDDDGPAQIVWVRKNLFDALRQLFSFNNVDEKRQYGHTDLHNAAVEGHTELAKYLLSQGASCGARDVFGETPLHYAAEEGHYEIVMALVASGADMNIYDDKGRLPIHCCIQRKRRQWEQVARFLRDAAFRSKELRAFHTRNGGIGLALESREPEYDKTPLIEAAEQGDLDKVKQWVRAGANLSAQDMFGETGLHYAAENGHYNVVLELVRAGADLEILDGTDRTPLDCCIQQKRRQWQEVRRFLEEPRFRQDELRRQIAEEMEQSSEFGAYLWIDAICINQNDLNERSSQVKIMPQIYSKAKLVIVWLGTQDSGNMKQVMQSMNAQEKNLQELQNQWQVSLRSYLEDNLPNSLIPEGGNLSIDNINMILGCFLRSWFSRAWVIQELSLAKEIRIFLGSEEFAWHDVLKFLCLLAHVGFFRNSEFWKVDAGWRMEDGKGGDGSEAWRLVEIRLRTANDDRDWALIDPILHNEQCQTPHVRRSSRLSLPLLLAATWSFECKDPRDKIYAILSMAKPLPEDEQISIDYASPVEDLFTQVAYQFLRGSGRDSIYQRHDGLAGILEPLEGLSYIQDPYFSGQQARMPELPTWVPDFSNPLVTDRIWKRSFTAANSLEPYFKPGPGKGTLELMGLEVDVVDMVEPGWANLDVDDMPPDLEIDVGSWLRLLEHISPRNNESPVRMLFRTLCLDRLWKDCNEDTRKKNIDSFRSFIAWEMAWLMEQEGEEEASELPSESDSVGSCKFDQDDSIEATAAESSTINGSFRNLTLGGSDVPQRDIATNFTSEDSREALIPSGSDVARSDGSPTHLDQTSEQGDADLDVPTPSNQTITEILGRLHTLDEAMNSDGQGFLPRLDEVSAQRDCLGTWSCKFHGPDCLNLDNSNNFRHHVVRIYRKRCLFRTSNGRLGLAPQFVRPGDSLWLFAGSRTPYLLREHTKDGPGKTFRFLGEAYLHGVMYGEALSSQGQADFAKIILI